MIRRSSPARVEHALGDDVGHARGDPGLGGAPDQLTVLGEAGAAFETNSVNGLTGTPGA